MSLALTTYNLCKKENEKCIIDQNLCIFSGHMRRGIDAIHAKLHDIDAVLEIHDARIPFSGRHPQLKEILNVRPHMLILNKVDLADKGVRANIVKKYREEGVTNIEFTHGIGRNIMQKIKKNIIPLMISNVVNEAYHKPNLVQGYNIMVVGVPNVGKSTLLNKISETFTRKGKLARVGAMPGVTRSVMNKVKVNFDPPICVVDTPGILNPRIPDVDVGMRLALCGCLPHNHVGEDIIADYLLYWLNKHGNYSYVDIYSLKEPTDDVYKFLAEIALQYKLVIKNTTSMAENKPYRVDFIRAARHVLKDFSEGKFGRVCLDDDKL